MPKLTFDEALERIADEHSVKSTDVRADALRRFVWVAEWHIPGCLSESSTVCLTKKDAIESALWFAEDGENPLPRGMATALRKYGRFDHRTDMYGDVVTTVARHRLSDIL